MADTDECRHGMNPEWCADCSGRDGGEAADYAKRRAYIDRGYAIAAVFAGQCARCDEHFPAGWPISMRSEGWVAWCCLDRSPAALRDDAGDSR